ncbi:nuclear transport factor 2 family protein [Flavobacterium sp.]|uniref:nuclear transport factor 2 family protein n=1 Tax=Flavobacterium sp. TaxID=239 RepID=UPI001B515130|nr:nuclear transport factor 2 family protein [Flavobacterium sp.]MBP6127327.1 nuclear transport factor 2 family protein [Flavobacterium sp.]
MKKIIVVIIGLVLIGCKSKQAAQEDLKLSRFEIDFMLNSWHQAAAEANFNNYFNAMTDDAIFIGTDATENWNKQEFIKFAKPFFDKGKAWNFTALERNVYFSSDKKTAWFDELLNTQMKICRGSGVLVVNENGNWKIKQYVLSMTIPNDHTDEVVKIKSLIEDKEIEKLKNQTK